MNFIRDLRRFYARLTEISREAYGDFTRGLRKFSSRLTEILLGLDGDLSTMDKA
ncbi:hypothetical protein [Bergeyella zoohelcum]|uniref:hypothetical protein n=1 Tax=Bergeyella zoohelcum TaxID=1015 RepID=UPI0015F0E6F7|nr:hypothetical protein [Bergeyella zoohelcum]